MLTPFEIYDGYVQHAENLKYLIFGGHFTRLATYLEEYLAWFLAPTILMLTTGYIISSIICNGFSIFKSDTHGSARWATLRELKKAGFLKTKEELGTGVILGTVWYLFRKFFVVNEQVHTNLIAPTRSGKGIGSVNATTLTYDGSLFVNDPKGELYCINRRERENRGDKIFLVDPFNVVKKHYKKGRTQNMTEEQAITCKFNPLANVFTNQTDCQSRVEELINAFCPKTSAGEDSYFDKMAKIYLTTVALYLCECRDKKIDCGYPATLPGVRDFLAASTEEIMGHVENMIESPIPSVRNSGQDMKKVYANGEGEKLWGSIMSSITSYVSMLDDLNLRDFFSDHTVDTHMLCYKPISLFYVSPTSKKLQGIAIARLLYTDALLWVQEEHPETENLQRMKQNCLFILDEFPQLKKFEIVEDGMGIMMGLGVTFFIISQGTYQLQKEYGKEGWRTFEGNAISVFLGSRERETAKEISETIGHTTVKNKAYSTKGQLSSSETGRPLITPDEVIALGPKHPIVMIGEGRPAKVDQIKYFNISWMKKLADKNPYRES